MSAYFSTASTSNYLQYNAGSNSTFSFPFTIACWVKHGALTALSYPFSVAHDAGGGASNRYSCVGTDYVSSSMRYAYNHRSETFTGGSSGSGVNPPADTWYALILVCSSATSRALYYGTSSASYSYIGSTNDSGSLLSIRYATIGNLFRASGSISSPFAGYVARAARWTVALTAGEIEDYLDGVEPSSIQAGSLWAYWKLNGASLTDTSGNGRNLSETGTVGDSTDEPFADTVKYLKLLADSPAASATGVDVVVYSAPSGSNYVTGTTRYGSATGKSFESSLESGNAVLKIPAADVGCDGLAASTLVAALARNTTYTTGMVEATIIEE